MAGIFVGQLALLPAATLFGFSFQRQNSSGLKIILWLHTWRTVCATLALVLTQSGEQ
jgi:hypothetical protein